MWSFHVTVRRPHPPPQSSLRNDYSTAIRRGEAFRTQDAKTMDET